MYSFDNEKVIYCHPIKKAISFQTLNTVRNKVDVYFKG